MATQQATSDHSAFQSNAQTRERPLGVVIMALLALLGGITNLYTAYEGLRQGGIFGEAADNTDVEAMFDFASTLFTAVGVVALIVALVFFLMAWGFLAGKGWSATIAKIVMAIVLIFGLLGFIGTLDPIILITMVVIPGLIIVYLRQPQVRAWFTA